MFLRLIGPIKGKGDVGVCSFRVFVLNRKEEIYVHCYVS